jgi:hypothetical protein
MLRALRTVVLLAFSGGGAWAAFQGLDMLVRQVDNGRDFHLTTEGTLLVVPICVLGALIGAFLGGIMLPRTSR